MYRRTHPLTSSFWQLSPAQCSVRPRASVVVAHAHTKHSRAVRLTDAHAPRPEHASVAFVHASALPAGQQMDEDGGR